MRLQEPALTFQVSLGGGRGSVGVVVGTGGRGAPIHFTIWLCMGEVWVSMGRVK